MDGKICIFFTGVFREIVCESNPEIARLQQQSPIVNAIRLRQPITTELVRDFLDQAGETFKLCENVNYMILSQFLEALLEQIAYNTVMSRILTRQFPYSDATEPDIIINTDPTKRDANTFTSYANARDYGIMDSCGLCITTGTSTSQCLIGIGTRDIAVSDFELIQSFGVGVKNVKPGDKRDSFKRYIITQLQANKTILCTGAVGYAPNVIVNKPGSSQQISEEDSVYTHIFNVMKLAERPDLIGMMEDSMQEYISLLIECCNETGKIEAIYICPRDLRCRLVDAEHSSSSDVHIAEADAEHSSSSDVHIAKAMGKAINIYWGEQLATNGIVGDGGGGDKINLYLPNVETPIKIPYSYERDTKGKNLTANTIFSQVKDDPVSFIKHIRPTVCGAITRVRLEGISVTPLTDEEIAQEDGRFARYAGVVGESHDNMRQETAQEPPKTLLSGLGGKSRKRYRRNKKRKTYKKKRPKTRRRRRQNRR